MTISPDIARAQDPTTDDEEVLTECRERMDEAVEMWSDIHEEARDDIRFRNGDQYPEEVLNRRKNKLTMVFNQMETYIAQVVGTARQNRAAIEVVPVDGEYDADAMKVPNVAGTKDYDLAQVYEGLIRQIEYASRAEDAYDTALDHAVGSGFGFFRIVTQYAGSGFDKEIRIRRVPNPLSVMIDLSDPGMTGEGANWGFIQSWMTHDEKKRLYGEDSLAGRDAFTQQGISAERWWSDDKERIVEYFRRIPNKRKIVLLETRERIDLGDDRKTWDEQIATIESHGGRVIESRMVDSTKVEWMVTDGLNILDGPIDFPSRYIPIVMVAGRELNIDGEIRFRSLIRFAKDAQRYYNYKRNAIAERVALGTKAPWTGPASAFKGFESIWREANRQDLAFIPWNDDAREPPQRNPAPDLPVADFQEAQAAENDIKLTTGIFNSGLGQPGPETSGKAILAKQQASDVGTYQFHDNLHKAISHAGRIIIDMIPKVYDSQRLMRIRTFSDEDDVVAVNIDDPQTGTKLYDLGAAEFDVRVKAGGNYITQREKFVETVAQIFQGNPEMMQIIGDVFFKNMDSPGADELAKRFRAMLPAEIKQAEASEDNNEGEQQPTITPEMVQQAVDQAVQQALAQSDAQIKQAELELKQRELEIDQMKAETDAQAKAKELAIKEAQIQAEAIQRQRDAMGQSEEIERVREEVAEAIAQFVQSGEMPDGVHPKVEDNDQKPSRETINAGGVPVQVIVGGKDDGPRKKRAFVRRVGDGEYVMESVEVDDGDENDG